MAKHVLRSVDLDDADARFVDQLVDSGSFASASDVVRAGLDALRQGDLSFASWLTEHVVPAYDEIAADQSTGLTPDQVRQNLLAHHEARDRSRE